MPGKSERLKVEINESSAQDIRTFNITLTAPLSEFQLTDLLKHRGVISGLDAHLKQAVKDATDAYIKSAENLISSLANSSPSKRKSRTKSSDNKPSVTQAPATRT